MTPYHVPTTSAGLEVMSSALWTTTTAQASNISWQSARLRWHRGSTGGDTTGWCGSWGWGHQPPGLGYKGLSKHWQKRLRRLLAVTLEEGQCLRENTLVGSVAGGGGDMSPCGHCSPCQEIYWLLCETTVNGGSSCRPCS